MSTRTDTLVPFTTLVRSNKAQEADQAERVAMQVDARLRDQLAVLEGVRALYQSDDTASGFGVRSYLAALQPRVRAPGMQGVGIAVAMRRATTTAAEQRLRDSSEERRGGKDGVSSCRSRGSTFPYKQNYNLNFHIYRYP